MEDVQEKATRSQEERAVAEKIGNNCWVKSIGKLQEKLENVLEGS